jgi:hypothetical protein
MQLTVLWESPSFTDMLANLVFFSTRGNSGWVLSFNRRSLGVSAPSLDNGGVAEVSHPDRSNMKTNNNPSDITGMAVFLIEHNISHQIILCGLKRSAYLLPRITIDSIMF